MPHVTQSHLQISLQKAVIHSASLVSSITSRIISVVKSQYTGVRSTEDILCGAPDIDTTLTKCRSAPMGSEPRTIPVVSPAVMYWKLHEYDLDYVDEISFYSGLQSTQFELFQRRCSCVLDMSMTTNDLGL